MYMLCICTFKLIFSGKTNSLYRHDTDSSFQFSNLNFRSKEMPQHEN